MEKALLAVSLASRENYALVKNYIDVKSNTYSKEFLVLLGKAGEYYARDSTAEHVVPEVLMAQLAETVRSDKLLDRLGSVLSDAVGAATSVANVKAVVLLAKQQEVADKLAAALGDVSNGKVDQLMTELASLRQAEEIPSADTSNIEVFHGVDLMDLMAKEYDPENIIKVYPLAVSDRLDGGAHPGHHIVVFARPECFTEDTEVMTDSGWLSVKDVTTDTAIGVVDSSLRLSFEAPSSTVVRDDFKYLYRIHNRKGQLDLVVSPGHRMIYEWKGGLKEDTAEDIKYFQGKKTHTAVLGTGSKVFSSLDALAVAYQADGRARVYKGHGYSGSGYGYEIVIKKERKVERLKFLLEDVGIEYSSWKDSRGHIGFYFKTEADFDKDFSWINLSDVSVEYARSFAQELALWDGSTRSTTRWKYSNTNEAAVDKAQAVVSLAGYNTFKSSVPDKRGYTTCHELHIRTNYTPVDGGNVQKEKIEDTLGTKLYCFTVSTGMVLVRRKGVVSVQGNTGKSAFVINASCGFAYQNKKVLYVINEDRPQDIIMRHISNLSGMNKHDIRDNPRMAQDLALDRGWGNVVVASAAPGSPDDIRRLIDKEDPAVVIGDQLRNFKVRAENRTNQLEIAATEMRNIGKEANVLVMSVTQAGDSASNKLVLEQGDVDGSNTGIPAQADVMIGIGVDASTEAEGVRIVSLPKNKIGGVHDSFPVRINTQLSRYTNV